MSGATGRAASRTSVRAGTVRGGLPGVVLAHPAGGRVEVALHGGHLLSWTRPDGDEVFFLSREAVLDGAAAIRGGVPVVFPQFGPGALPKHGFARTMRWTLAASADDGPATARLALEDDARTREAWPHPFRLELELSLAESLALRLSVTNRGRTPLALTAALHGYLRVADIRRARLHGLRGRTYVDQLRGGARLAEGSDALAVEGPVDRIYLDAPSLLRLEDRAGGREIEIASEGFPDVVVWNPWSTGAAALPDLADDEYREMLCVEGAAAATPVRLAPGERWSGTQRLRVVRIDATDISRTDTTR